MPRYTKEEDQFIIDNYSKMPAAEIAAKLDRRRDAIYTRANYLGVRRKTKRWGDLSGKTFDKLKVLKPVETDRNGHKRYLCECTCGKQKNVLAGHLQTGKIRSCGCLLKRRGADHPNFNGYGEIHLSFYSAIKNSATQKNKSGRQELTFDVSIEYLWELFLLQERKCNLSGIEIEFGETNVGAKTASLDRIDSSKGYVEGNVQWVHKDVNLMKRTYEQDYFIDLCSKIAHNFNLR
jgi:hypothetical protein